MPEIRAMVFDLDGTLLSPEGCLSAGNERALKACLAHDVLLCAATARPRRFMYCLGKPPGQLSFMASRGVFYNGALAVDDTRSYRRQWTMPAEITRELVADLMAIAPDLHIAIQLAHDGHAFRLPMSAGALAEWPVIREELQPFTHASRQSCAKIVAWHESLSLAQAYARLRSRYAGVLNVFLTDAGHMMQFMDARATPENALLNLLHLHGVAPSRVAVFGDGPPDLGMFRTFGFSVAMGNAVPEIKAAATHVTGDCQDDGVAKAIHECFGIG